MSLARRTDRPIRSSLQRRPALAACLLFLPLAAACSGADAPDAGGDPVLEQGRDVWVRQCSSCHGTAGGGGRGPKLAEGEVEASLTEEEQFTVVHDGRSSMPGFGEKLTDEEIDAVIAYTRDIL